jgi:hypothetical protein
VLTSFKVYVYSKTYGSADHPRVNPVCVMELETRPVGGDGSNETCRRLDELEPLVLMALTLIK